MILEAGKAAGQEQEVEARAYQAGKRHPCVVAIAAVRNARTFTIGSGVYLGIGPDGRHGHVLTAAHVALNARFEGGEARSDPEPQALIIGFGPDSLAQDRREAALWVTACRATCHLGRREAENRPVDLALLSFRLDDAAVAFLREHRILPPRLRANCGGLEAGAAGQVAGFGWFGTSAGDTLASAGRIHAGPVQAHYLSEDQGRFWVVVPAAPGSAYSESVQESKAGPAKPFHWRFTPAEAPRGYVPDTDGKARLTLRTPAGQAFPAQGDSGGPLFLETAKDGLLLVGIHTMGFSLELVPAEPGAGPQPVAHHVAEFESVPDHLGWLRGALESKGEGARQLELLTLPSQVFAPARKDPEPPAPERAPEPAPAPMELEPLDAAGAASLYRKPGSAEAMLDVPGEDAADVVMAQARDEGV